MLKVWLNESNNKYKQQFKYKQSLSKILSLNMTLGERAKIKLQHIGNKQICVILVYKMIHIDFQNEIKS